MKSSICLSLALLTAGFSPGNVLAQGESIDEIQRRIVEKVETGHRESGHITEMLAQAGLSPQDAERIAAAFVDGILACLLEAAESRAEAESVDFRDVLLEIEVSLDDPDAGEPGIIDIREAELEAESCALREMQTAGISYDLLLQNALSAAESSAGD